ncbi:MAG: hypothetical protein CW346_09845 [Bacillaceae bacterium]|nr:hypothetical protein [Bacillaceae bacterium]
MNDRSWTAEKRMQKKQVRQRTRRSFVLKQQRFKDKKTDDDPYGQKKHFYHPIPAHDQKDGKGDDKNDGKINLDAKVDFNFFHNSDK